MLNTLATRNFNVETKDNSVYSSPSLDTQPQVSTHALPHSISNTQSQPLTESLTRTHSFIHSLSLSLSHTLSVAHVTFFCLLPFHSYKRSLSHTHKDSHSHLITHRDTRSLSLARPSLSLTHFCLPTHSPT